ncbi:amidohydrolase family protein [Chloroflexota bacterium]
MEHLEIIDAHVHLAKNSEEESYWLFPGRRSRDRYGTPEKAVEYMKREGISKMVFLTLPARQCRAPLAEKIKIASLPKKQRREAETEIFRLMAPIIREYNDWGIEVNKQLPQLLPFSCIAPELGGSEGMVKEVELRASQGVKGIKLHPGLFSFFPYEDVMFPVYDKCQEIGLPICTDSGTWPMPQVLAQHPPLPLNAVQQDVIDYGEPKHWGKVAEAFPKLKVILAHLGSAWWDERVELALKYPNFYFDTSQGFSAPDRMPHSPHRGMAEDDVPRIFRKIGVERILFGTDCMGLDPQPQLEQILRTPLTGEEKQVILADNAKRLLHI